MNNLITFITSAIQQFWNAVFVNNSVIIGTTSISLNNIINGGIILTAFIVVLGIILNRT